MTIKRVVSILLLAFADMVLMQFAMALMYFGINATIFASPNSFWVIPFVATAIAGISAWLGKEAYKVLQ